MFNGSGGSTCPGEKGVELVMVHFILTFKEKTTLQTLPFSYSLLYIQHNFYNQLFPGGSPRIDGKELISLAVASISESFLDGPHTQSFSFCCLMDIWSYSSFLFQPQLKMELQTCRNLSEQILGDSEGQGRPACCSPWGRKESDMTL